jgi:predicted aconitase
MSEEIATDLQLNDVDRAMLAGELGPAPQLAARVIVRMAEVQGAETLLDIEGAHIDSSLYMGDATLIFAERLAEMGAQVSVPSTLNVSGVDEHGWQHWSVPEDWAHKAHRQMLAYQSMGCIPTWTCAPYQTMYKPEFGQQIAWGESNAIIFANSVIGARTERYPDLMDICAAITARVPAVGLHLDENRIGQILIRLKDIPAQVQESDAFFPVLGHWMGKVVGEKIPVLLDMAVEPTEDQLKSFGAAAASSGSVGLYHIVGLTPEAKTFKMAFKSREPEQVIELTMADLRAAWDELTTSEGAHLDMVVLGSPHFSLQEFAQLAPLLEGKTKHPKVKFLVTSSRAMAAFAEKGGYLQSLKDFGASVTLDTCILTTPMLSPEIKIIMTNSPKYAYYAPGLLDTEVVFGSLKDCVNSAVAGKVTREDALWSG